MRNLKFPAEDLERFLAVKRSSSSLPTSVRILLALAEPGSTRRGVATRLYVSEVAVKRAVRAYRRLGLDALLRGRDGKRGRPPKGFFPTDEERSQLEGCAGAKVDSESRRRARVLLAAAEMGVTSAGVAKREHTSRMAVFRLVAAFKSQGLSAVFKLAKRGRPFDPKVEARLAQLLDEGCSAAKAAAACRVSPQTVRRYWSRIRARRSSPLPSSV